MALSPEAGSPREDKRAVAKAAQQDALLREIDDAVRAGDVEDFLARWGKPLLGVLVAGLAIFAGVLFWNSRQQAAQEKDGETLVAAVDQLQAGNIDSARKTLAGFEPGSAGAAAAAQMLDAGMLAQQGKTDEAAKIFSALAADTDAPQELRDLALIREMALTFDTTDKAQVIAALKPLAVPGKAFFPSAGELVAQAYLAQGKRAEAGALFGQIAKDEAAPDSLRSRARQMAGMLGVDTIEDVDALLEEQGVTKDEAAAAAPAPATEG